MLKFHILSYICNYFYSEKLLIALVTLLLDPPTKSHFNIDPTNVNVVVIIICFRSGKKVKDINIYLCIYTREKKKRRSK